ncbi:hypothetical protein AX17_000803 [Amanita inopinata Kibby_2008]|nr:hypothetical protein AX17_000803 [Amanita inopinata Kibby_2008]
MSTYSPSPSFHEAAHYLSNASSLSNVSSTVKLELYGLFKFLTTSPTPLASRPSIFDMTGRAKWDAWNAIGKKYSSSEQAEQRYNEIAKSLGWSEGASVIGKQVDEEDVDLDALDDEKSEGKGSDSRASGGMGLAVSVVQAPSVVKDHSVHGLAVANDVAGLTMLLEQSPKADINVRDEFGYTPLHLAADRGNMEVVKLLLSKGADAALKDADGFSALELATVTGHEGIQELLTMPS